MTDVAMNQADDGSRRYTYLAVAITLAAILISASVFFAATTFTTTVTKTSTKTTTLLQSTTGYLNSTAYLMKVNGSFYWADDVSKDIVIGMPGYSYFLNGSVSFDGVKFETICPPIYRDCPGSNSSSTIVAAGAIRFNMTFPDGTVETTGQVIGDSFYTFVISQHYPRAGMLVEYVNDYPHNSIVYGVFLLVSSCCAPPYLG